MVVPGQSRQTGTVPKTKQKNESSRGQPLTPRLDHGINSTPNNLDNLEWQPDCRPGPSQRKTNKTSNHENMHSVPINSSSLMAFDVHDLIDLPDVAVTLDLGSNRRSSSSQSTHSQCYQPKDDQFGSFQDINYSPLEATHGSGAAASKPGGSRRDTSSKKTKPQNVLLPKETKSKVKIINLSKPPNRAVVEGRLSQIQDYIAQTTALMESLKSSGEVRDNSQYNKLLGMVSDLRDSEIKLQFIINGLDDVVDEAEASAVNDDANMEFGSTRSSPTQATTNTHQLAISNQELNENSPLAIIEAREQLIALQNHQSSLAALEKSANAQLSEAKSIQEKLRAQARIVTKCSQDANGSRTTQEVGKVAEQLQSLQGRLSNLHEMYDNRNELAHLLGERDEELNSEYLIVQNKLKDLQLKKQIMNKLIEEVESGLPQMSPTSHSPNNQQASNGVVTTNSDDSLSDDGSSNMHHYDPNSFKESFVRQDSFKHLQAKIEEANNLKAQVQTLMRNARQFQDQELSVIWKNDGGGRRGSQSGSCVSDGSNVQTSLKSGDMGGKQDNNARGSEVDRHCNIPKKVNRDSNSANCRLAQIQSILSVVSAQYSQGQPISADLLELLGCQDDNQTSEVASSANRERASSSRSRDGYSHHSLTNDSRIWSIETAHQSDDQASCSSDEHSLQEYNKHKKRSNSNCQLSTTNLSSSSDDAQPEELTDLPVAKLLGSKSQGRPTPSLEEIQEMTRSMQQQSIGMRQHALGLANVTKEIRRMKCEIPLHKKKTNTQAVSQQMLSELQARKCEFEGLMRKDKGRTSAANQDNCSEISPDKSDTPGYSFQIAEEANSIQSAWVSQSSAQISSTLELNESQQGQNAASSDEEVQRASLHTQLPFFTTPLNNSQNVSQARDAHSIRSVQSNAASLSNSQVGTQRAQSAQPRAQHNVWPRNRQHELVEPFRQPQAQPYFMSGEWIPNHADYRALQKENVRLRCEVEQLSLVQDQYMAAPSPSSYYAAPHEATPSYQRQYQNQVPPRTPTHESYRINSMSAHIAQCNELLIRQQREIITLSNNISQLTQQLCHSERMHNHCLLHTPGEGMGINSTNYDTRPHQSNLARSSNHHRTHPNIKHPYSAGLSSSQSAHSLPNLARELEANISSLNENYHGLYYAPDELPPQQQQPMQLHQQQHFSAPRSIPPVPPLIPITPRALAPHNNSANNCTRPMLIDHGPWGDMTGHGPTQALNNQVPPGNRTNNYLDNFRSYSRQNLLSSSACSKEGSTGMNLVVNERNVSQQTLADNMNEDQINPNLNRQRPSDYDYMVRSTSNDLSMDLSLAGNVDHCLQYDYNWPQHGLLTLPNRPIDDPSTSQFVNPSYRNRNSPVTRPASFQPPESYYGPQTPAGNTPSIFNIDSLETIRQRHFWEDLLAAHSVGFDISRPNVSPPKMPKNKSEPKPTTGWRSRRNQPAVPVRLRHRESSFIAQSAVEQHLQPTTSNFTTPAYSWDNLCSTEMKVLLPHNSAYKMHTRWQSTDPVQRDASALQMQESNRCLEQNQQTSVTRDHSFIGPYKAVHENEEAINVVSSTSLMSGSNVADNFMGTERSASGVESSSLSPSSLNFHQLESLDPQAAAASIAQFEFREQESGSNQDIHYEEDKWEEDEIIEQVKPGDNNEGVQEGGEVVAQVEGNPQLQEVMSEVQKPGGSCVSPAYQAAGSYYDGGVRASGFYYPDLASPESNLQQSEHEDQDSSSSDTDLDQVPTRLPNDEK